MNRPQTHTSLEPAVFQLLPFCFSLMVICPKFQQYYHKIADLSFSIQNFLFADLQTLIGHSQAVIRFSPVDLLIYLNDQKVYSHLSVPVFF